MPAMAQPLSGPPADPQYKYSTPMPLGVATPNKLETRIGTLNFFDGFPGQASTEKIYDNLDFQRAVQAYLLGAAGGEPGGQPRRHPRDGAGEHDRADLGSTWSTPRTVELTANNNTPYTWFWMDLRNGPLVIEAPPKVLGLVNDIWYHWNGDIGFTGPDKGRGGKYLLLPPSYKGDVPGGYFVIRPGSFSVWAVLAKFPRRWRPKPGVDEVKKIMKIYPLSQAANPPELKFVNMSGKPFNMIGPGDFRFWEMLNKVVQDEPTDTVDATTLGFWASVGIQKGQPFVPDERMKKILTEAAIVGDATCRALGYRVREKAALHLRQSAMEVSVHRRLQVRVATRRSEPDAATMFLFMATGVTPAMDTKIVGEGSIYPVDADNHPFDGGNNYKLHLPPNIPVKTFWSVIVYDTQTRSMLQTNQQYPSVSSQKKDLLVNADGSVDVWFGPRAPAGKEPNWVQTIPGKAWFMILRLYGPLEPWFNRTWRPDDIVLVK